MKKNFRLFFCICCTLPLLIQCIATQKEIQSTNIKVYGIDSRVEDIDNQVEKLKTETVKQVQTSQALVGNRLDNQEAELLQLKGKLEEIAHYNRLLREENKEADAGLTSSIDEMDNSLQKKFAQLSASLLKIEDRITQLNQRMKIVEENIEKANKERADEAAQRARQAAERAREAAQAVEDAQAKAKIISSDGSVHISAEKHKKIITDQPEITFEKSKPAAAAAQGTGLYEEALALFKGNKFSKAYDVFGEYLNNFPQGDMAANARFWLGECLYSQKEYELAILDYQKVIVDYPRHSKAPASLLKQAMAFENLKDKETARIVYQKVLDNYPQSEQVEAAQKRLEGLK